MNNQILSVQSGNISQIGPNRSVFKDGASVFVKILGDNGDGTYKGAIGGNRVTVTSSRTLDVGSSFVATITGKNGKIFITPKDSLAGSVIKPSINVSVLESGKLGQVLADLGLPVNVLSGNLLKMMMQLDMKVDGDVLRGIYNLAVKHKGKEKAAGEILLLLKQKGIPVDDYDIDELIGFLESVDWSDGGNSYGSGDDSDKKSKEMISRINGVDGGWFLVPYNLVRSDDLDGDVLGAGVLRILVDKWNRLKLINVNCYFGEKEFLFSLNFKGNVCSGVKFCVEPDDGGRYFYRGRLSKMFEGDGIDVEWCEKQYIEGFGSEGEVVRGVEGEM